MIFYVTYNDQPSGVYWSQVTDVVEHLNTLGGEEVRLVALVSVRNFFRSRRSIQEHSKGAIVLPMVPGVHNWRANKYWLTMLAHRFQPSGVISRGVFATALGLHLRERGLVRSVCYDGRGAYGVEWEEYRIVDDDALIEECRSLEAEAVERADIRLAVSEALVSHWRIRYGYAGNDHVVIPCTLGRDHKRMDPMDPVEFRGSLGWAMCDLVMVYSGSTVGWQSLGMVAKVLERMLALDRSSRVLFLSAPDGHIDHLRTLYPDQVARRWLPHSEVHGALAACDAGLLIRSDSVTNQVASPTKFAEYLHAGIPVLVSAHIGDLGPLVANNRLGWLHDPSVIPQVYKPDDAERARLREFSRKHLTKQAFDQEYEAILTALTHPAKVVSSGGTLVSIVVPSFNKGRYIEDMVASVLAQSHPNWEMVFVDDGSTDDTRGKITAMAVGDPRIRTHFLPENKGANHCRNLGVELARGEFIIYLDADDLLGPDCLRDRLGWALREELDLCVFTMEVFKKKVGDGGNRWIPSSKDPLADFFRHKLPWSVMQPIWRRDFLRRIGGFDESYKRHQDVEFHTRALLEPGVRYRTVVGEPDCYYRISEERKVLRPYELLDGFTESSLEYHAKFREAAVKERKASMLLGIIYQTYLQILINFKNKVIGKEEFHALEQKLLAPDVRQAMGPVRRMLFRLARTYTLLPVRVPGINMVLYRAITG